ncbi:MAG: DUF2845 domain-containing protein [Myxococcales bacterium]|nr:DUF2845 domain-containing protein [Myxococcales bacterium]
MARPFSWALGLAIGVTFALEAADAQAALRCGRRLVNEGDSALRLRSYCGEPDDIHRYSDVRALFDLDGRRLERITFIENWIFLRGEGDLPRIVRLEDGVVTAIEVAGFVVRLVGEDSPERCRRQLFDLQRTSIAEVRITCGPPHQRDHWQEELVAKVDDIGEVRRLITRERWLYNFGPNHLVRLFEFANGRLLEQRTGDRGF